MSVLEAMALVLLRPIEVQGPVEGFKDNGDGVFSIEAEKLAITPLEKAKHTVRAALAEARRLGWQLVPVEPTKKMWQSALHSAVWDESMWSAMIASAPSIEEG